MSDLFKADAVYLNHQGEWAEFFFHERPTATRSDGSLRHSASWCCHSSFGTFGHYWHDMGEPFAEFISRIDSGYLLSKIARREVDDDTGIESVKREIAEARREKAITKEQARDAWNSVDALAEEHSGEVLFYEMYGDDEINAAKIDWCNVTTLRVERSAERFVEVFWKMFVHAVNAKVCQ